MGAKIEKNVQAQCARTVSQNYDTMLMETRFLVVLALNSVQTPTSQKQSPHSPYQSYIFPIPP